MNWRGTLFWAVVAAVLLAWGIPQAVEVAAQSVVREQLPAEDVTLEVSGPPWMLAAGRIPQLNVAGSRFDAGGWAADRFTMTVRDVRLRPLDLLLQQAAVVGSVGRVTAELYFAPDRLDIAGLRESRYLTQPELTFHEGHIRVTARLRIEGREYPTVLTLRPVLTDPPAVAFRLQQVEVDGHVLPERYRTEVVSALEQGLPEIPLDTVGSDWQVDDVAATADGLRLRLTGPGRAVLP